ncbi:amidase [Shewanella sp. Isolate11]|uniref:amidase n=1 Tax=Shewanella sp. Isolate11 TaxID=2908530 RepID=UPI001EFE6E1D|nr:amidase [Shewanella sp. Isolate11]MCG9698157.1 amidase [Shewanella sp. Isolate11]
MGIKTRLFATALIISGLSACASQNSNPSISLSQANLLQLQQQLQRGQLTSEQLVGYYLQRIDALNHNGPQLNAVISINPNALAQAKEADKQRQLGNLTGPLQGIPVLLKDNIDTGDGLANTAGSVLFKDNYPKDDAFIVQQLRKAGAIILGKSNLSEWANFRSTRSSSGWSGIGNQTRNPYDTSTSPCGSSSGSAVAVAADLVSLAVGTETDGSVVCPSAMNGVVGIKPTVGLISRDGIIPISHSQDTAGPMARSVTGAVILLDALASYDKNDHDSYSSQQTFATHLTLEGLKGKRIGVVRNLMGYHPILDARFEEQLKLLQAQGAVLVNNVNLPEMNKWQALELPILLHEFRQGIADYLNSTELPYKTLTDLIEANKANANEELGIFGQELFEMADNNHFESQQAYQQALSDAKQLAGKQGIDAVLAEHKLDLLIAPTVGPAWKIDHINGDHYLGAASSPAAVAGYPHITVPMGLITAGDAKPLPVGLSFFGTAKSEATLIEAAYGYEQASQARLPPKQ